MKKHVITIGKRDFSLAFTLQTMIRMQENIPGFDFTNLDEMIRKPHGMVDLLYELALSGEALEDRQLDVTKEWMAERVPATSRGIFRIQTAIMDTLTDGMEMETEEEADEDREVDVVLEDIKKKDAKTD